MAIPRKDSSQAKRGGKNLAPGGDAFENPQIDLFQTFLCNSEDERNQLSNTIDLWDSIPRYSISRQEQNKRRTAEGFLSLLEIDFRYKGKDFTIAIQPAKIRDEDGEIRDYYPSANEELVEDALRKIASERSQGYFDDASFRSGVMFTIYMLREELSRRGHTRSHAEIVKSLNILAGSMIEIRTNGGDGPGEGFSRTNYLPGLAAISKRKLRDDPDAKWIAQFHPLVTQSIHTMAYRQYDYHQMMSHSTQLARWLRKQISGKFTFASLTETFEILYSTVDRDSNLINYSRIRDGIAALDAAFDELRDRGAIATIQKEVIRGPHNKIFDVRYILSPSLTFVHEVKAANKRVKLVLDNKNLSDTSLSP